MFTSHVAIFGTRVCRWGRVAEGAGEDPFLGAAFARARVQGFQGPDLSANDSMVACLKHYAGYGGVAAGLDYSATDVSEVRTSPVQQHSQCSAVATLEQPFVLPACAYHDTLSVLLALHAGHVPRRLSPPVPSRCRSRGSDVNVCFHCNRRPVENPP